MTRLELLERIADKAEELLSLERELVRTSDPQRVLRTVKEVRQELRELFRERREKS